MKLFISTSKIIFNLKLIIVVLTINLLGCKKENISITPIEKTQSESTLNNNFLNKINNEITVESDYLYFKDAQIFNETINTLESLDAEKK